MKEELRGGSGEIRNVYLDYLYTKIKEKDWHGVIDIALDLMELEIREEMSKEK